MRNIKPIISSLLRSKSGPVLLLTQIVLSVAIVANASFIISERLALIDRPSGIAEAQVLSFRVYNFDPAMDLRKQNQQDQLILRDLPGVIAATSTNMVPLSGSGWGDRYVDGPDPETAKSLPGFSFYMGNEHMLNTFGVKLVEGRNFYPEEIKMGPAAKSQTALITKSIAEAHWGDESPLGKVVYQQDIAITIVGVIERLQGAWVDSSNFEYSVIQAVDFGGAMSSTTYLVRAKPQDIAQLKLDIPKALHLENPNRVIDEFYTVAEHRGHSYSNHELMAALLSVMIVLLLLITSLGLTGMVMFNIQRRTKQIGTRRALGARKADIVWYFLTENYVICAAGAVIGVVAASQLGQQLMNHYSLPQLAWQYPAVTVLGLFVVTTLAVILPARRAADIPPSLATRSV
ncbi:ABC transporter permease [Simiduia aestuariiviva]|uniref:Putative ABC transport system permease protein n=1 Tax=Simiduia aestuariiviva TaxID=1510459 RepID=A0A839UN02_9GAMM|nr:FtsX-like permease family protein [Simiduia aestuariiviva]MBB3169222.1 putative ABC transport system permease protein [Simiduia aestuariiviva]